MGYMHSVLPNQIADIFTPNDNLHSALSAFRINVYSALSAFRMNIYSALCTLLKDNKKFWDVVKPKFTGKSKLKSKISLIENDEIVSDEQKVAEILNNNFVDAVPNLGIEVHYVENVHESPNANIEEKIDAIIDRYKSHPSIVMIGSKVKVVTKFRFRETTAEEMYRKILKLDSKKQYLKVTFL
jgi:hypothetical protein